MIWALILLAIFSFMALVLASGNADMIINHKQDIGRLLNRLSKLEAVVAETVDHVYGDKQ